MAGAAEQTAKGYTPGKAETVSQTMQGCVPETESSTKGRLLEEECTRGVFPVQGVKSPKQEEQGELAATSSQPSLQPAGGTAVFEAVESFSCEMFGQSPNTRMICADVVTSCSSTKAKANLCGRWNWFTIFTSRRV